ncbi:MAG: hypothetical protein DYH06_21260, partial [Acidobacteria bacterium ACB2]|nr:hypothetical protein [Acidobacteria bacterium ACB2]
MALDEKVRAALRELGAALNEAVSSSERVHEILGRIRAEGYDPYLVLDATVGLERKGRQARAALPSIRRGSSRRADPEDPAFRIDVKDVGLLRALGIDPTRSPRARR